MNYFVETKNLKLVNHSTLVATMTICINDVIEMNNCKLVYSDKTNSYKLFYPNVEYTSTKTKKTAYFPLVKLSTTLQAKALIAAIESYEAEKDS